ncbi:multiprotein-bridging factor 1 family protein [Streptomyces sp. NPDC005775]|uniref:helix-turn-helix domain-containing protein n=1 Tax=unclassified Streptomyces TaxID=2593676 RepID=UPI00340BA135
MPGPRKLDPSSSPRALPGAELRHRREDAGLPQSDLGAPLFVSGSFIGQLESGVRRIQMDQAEKFDEMLGQPRTHTPRRPGLKRRDPSALSAEWMAGLIPTHPPCLAG